MRPAPRLGAAPWRCHSRHALPVDRASPEEWGRIRWRWVRQPVIGTRSGGSMSTNDLLALLEERASAGTGPVLARTRGSIVFDAGPDGAWTLRLDRGSVALQHGPIDDPMSTISA